MRFRHLTSAVAQILLNASSGAILQASGTLVIGTASAGQGTSYVYDTNLELQSTLTGSGGYYGNEITIGENKFAVSTHDGNSNGGKVYIYNHDGSGEQVLTASDGANGNSFGATMDMFGDTLVVAAPEARKIYIYDLSAADIAASEVKIHKSAIKDFGRKIGVGGGKVVVATIENNTTWSGSKFITGSAFVYDIDGTNEVQLIPQQNGHTLGYDRTDDNTRSNDEFGKLVAIGGDKIFVGARMQGNDNKGALHVFSLDGTYETMITPSSPVDGSHFASGAIAVTDTKLVVTAPEYSVGTYGGKGTVYVFDHDGSNEVNFQSQHATSTMGRQSVAVLGNRIIVEWQGANSGKGQLHVFDMDGSNESVISPPPGIGSNDLWGNEIDAITGAYPMKMFVAEGRKTQASDQKIYVMDIDGENLIELPLPQGLSQPASSRFGDNIEVSGTNLVAIDPHAKRAYVYDLTSTNEPTSFSLDSTISLSATDNFVLEGNRLIVNRNPDASPGRILVYNITNGNLDASFANSDNVGFKQMDVGNGKIVANSGAGATRKVYVYDIDDTTGASETIIIPSSGATEVIYNPWRVAVGNGKIVVGDSHTDATFYIYNLDGSNEIAVDCSNIVSSSNRVGYKSIAIGNDKIVVDGGTTGVALVCDLDGSGLFAIDLSNSSYGLSPDEYAGAGTESPGDLSIINNKIIIAATQGRVSGNESDGIVYTFDLDGTNMKQIVSPRATGSGYNFGTDIAANDPTGLTKFANLPAVISNISSTYALIEGQDTVITAVGTDPEGDALTWSFEEVASGSSGLLVWDTSTPYFYDPATMTSPSGLNGALGRNGNHMDETYIYTGNGNHDGVGAIALHPLSDVSASPTILKAPSPTSGEIFGMATSSNDDYIFVGARSGAKVYVFNKSDLSHHTTLSATDASSRFGVSLSVNDTYLFVGASAADEYAGAVYVYDLATFTEQTKLLNPKGNYYFGDIIKSTNNKLMVSHRNYDTGRVFVYDTSDFSAAPVELEPVAPYTTESSFGMDLAVSTKHDKLFVCHRDVNDAVSGHAYGGAVYVYDLNNLSVTPEKILIEDSTEYFGEEISVVGNTVWIASIKDDSNSAIYGYDITDLDATPTIVQASGGQYFGITMSSTFPASALNGVTVTQSDNVFTVTPGTTDSNFTLRFKVTDAAGNVSTKTSTFAYDYVNKAPVVTGIVSNYNLTQGQDTVITAAATDPEGDAITWSYEEVLGSGVFVRDNNDTYLYNPSTMNLMETIQDPLAMMTVGDGKLVGKHGSSIKIYDLNDLSTHEVEIQFQSSAESIAITDDYLIVGHPSLQANRGEVWVFDRNDLNSSPINPYVIDKTVLTSPSSAMNREFGENIVVSGNKLICSQNTTPGESYGILVVYDLDDLSASPTVLNAVATLQDCSLAVAGTHFVVGIPFAYNGSQVNSGAAYIYDTENLSAAPISVPLLASRNAQFGTNVALSSDYVIIHKDSDNSVYVFDRNNLSATPATIYKPSNTGYHFGQDLAVSGDRLFVGDKSENNNTGKLYVYDFADLSSGTYLYNGQGTSHQISGSNTYVAFSDNMVGYVSSSALNGVTVSQSDNVLTVTPGTQDASFTLNIKATDSNGNVTTVPATFALDYQNQAPVVSGIQSAYTLTQGQDTVITAVGTDPEGDAITWSYEEVLGLGPGYVIVAAIGDEDNGNTSGSVYVYDANDLSATPTKLTAFDGAAYDYFGQSVAASADKIVVGAYRDDDKGSDSGSVYVYDTNDLSAQPTKLTLLDGVMDDFFGWSVAATADKIIVGARGDDSRTGAAYVYDANDLSVTPTKLTAFDGAANDFFGNSVAATDDKIYVGANRNSNLKGAVFVYDANDLSAQPTKLTAFDGDDYDDFGSRVAVTDDKIYVVARSDNSASGSVYVYDVNTYAFVQKLTAFDGAASDLFGESIAFADGKIFVSAINDDDKRGSVYAFDANDLSATPTKLTAFDGASDYNFGSSVTVSGDKLLVGSSTDADNGTQSGSVYVYDTNDLSATPTKLTAFDGAQGDKFGTIVASADVASSQLNGVTVSQSDNVFTVTPAQQDATFQLTFKATDTAGNVTSVPATFALDYQNQAPVVSGIQSAYTLTQGQDTVITATGTDPEGDAITWSFEEVMSGSRYIAVGASYDHENGIADVGSFYVYDAADLSAAPTKVVNPDLGSVDRFAFNSSVVSDKLFIGSYFDDDQGTNAGSVYVYDLNDLSATPTKMLPPTMEDHMYYGISISGNSTHCVIGANMQGTIYVYNLNDLSTPETTIVNPEGPDGDNFGFSCSFSDTHLVVGAYTADNMGAAYVYDANDLSASPTKLTINQSQSFGLRVAQSSNNIIVGCHAYNNNAGAAFVYDKSDLSVSPSVLQPSPATSGLIFGYMLAAFDDKIFVVNRGHDNYTGQVYVYDETDLANPTVLSPPNAVGGQLFGTSIFLSDNTLYIGAEQYSDSTGAMYAYDMSDLSIDPITITASDSENGDKFGSSISGNVISSALNGVTVSQSDNVLTVTPGQQDATFTLNIKATDSNGNTTTVPATFALDYQNQAPTVSGIQSAYTLTQGQDTVITAAATDPEGDAITWSFEEATSGSYAFGASAHDASNGTQNVGRVYLYDADGSNERIIESPVQSTNYQFGGSAFVTEDKVVVGAPEDTENGFRSGAVWVYDHDGSNQVKITASDGAQADGFGRYVSTGGGKIAVGAPDADHNGMFNTGAAYIYDIDGSNEIKIVPSDTHGGQEFGSRVLVANSKVYVVALKDNEKGNETGAVYIYNLDGSFDKKLLPEVSSGSNLHFGEGLAASSTHILISKRSLPGDSLTDEGRVQVFDLDGNYLFRLDNPTPENSDYFGWSVAANEDKFVIGSTEANGNSGSVYIYDTDGTNEIKVNPAGLASNAQFGRAVSIVGNRVIASSYDGVFSFALDGSDIQEITPAGSPDYTNITLSSFNSASQLNGVTVAQSDNVFTVTPAQQDAAFQLTFKATDSNGNVTTVPATFALDYQNQAPSVTGIDAAYTLTQGQDTVITAAATDPEGDAITWSFEEVMSGGGSQIVIGSFLKNNYSGSVFVYENGDLSSTPTEIYPSDVASGDRFGQEIAVTPSHMAVSTWNGSVYVYDQSDLSVAPTKLTSPEGVGNFGQEGLAINDTHLFVGQLTGGPDSNGVVYVYSLSDLSASPTELSQTGGEFLGDGGDRFGSVVAVDNQSLVVSAARYDDGVGAQNVGRLYVYDVNDLSAAPTIVSNVGYQDNKKTGDRELMLTSDKIIVGSSQHEDGSGVRKGAVFVHDRNNLDQAPVIVMGHEENGNFGLDAYSDGDILVVGASTENSSTGAAYVYDMSDLSAAPTKLTAYDGAANDSFGWEVYATASNILIGSYTDDDAGNNSGAVYVYDRSDLSVQPTKLIGQAANAYFGNTFAGYSPSSSLNGTTVSQSDNVFTVTPAQQDATFQLSFKATDSEGNVTSATSDFDFTYVNQAPSLGGIEPAYTLTQGVNEVIVPVVSDVEGETVTMSYEEVLGEGVPSGMNGTTVTQNGNDFTVTPGQQDANFTLRFTATDESGNQTNFDSEFTLDYNDAPSITGVDSSYTLDQGQDTEITVTTSDSDGDTVSLSYAVTSGDLSGTTVTQAGNVFTITPGDQDATFQLTFTATDTNGAATTATSDITFDYNAAPVITGIESVYTLTQGVDEVIVGMSSDADGDAVTWSFAEVLNGGVPSGLNGTAVTQNGGEFTVTPGTADANFTIRFTLTDTAGNTDTRDADFSLTYVNQAPSVTGIDSTYTLTQGQDTVITATGTDPEGDAITWSYEEVASGSSYVIVGSKRDDNVGAAYIYDWDGSSVSNEVRVTLDTTTAYDFTGSSVATNGSKVVIGSERNSTGTTRAGAILIADMDGSNKILVTTSDADTNDYIGTSVAINSTKVAVGAFNDDDAGSRSGSVYLFDLDGTNEVKITASDAAMTDFFGYSVALTETKVIVGSKNQNGSLGSIYVYDLDGSNEVQFSSSLTTGTPQVGYFIKTSSSKMIVGSDNDGAFIFDLDGSNEVHLTTAAVSNTGFGKRAAISESKAVVCAKSTGNSTAGEAFIFDLDGTNAIKITAPTPELGDGFGCSVEIVGDKVLVGADHMYQSHGGRVYIYNLDGTYVSYFESDYVSSEVGDNYAYSIGSFVPAASLGGTTVSQSDNVFTVTPGTQDATFQLTFRATDTAGNVTSTTSDFDFTYVAPGPDEYLLAGTMWSEGTGVGSVKTFDTSGTLLQSVATPGNITYGYANFGKIVATNGVKMAVGAPAEQDGGVSNHGEVTIFNIDGSSPISVIYEDGRDTNSGDEVGDALAMSDNYMYLGVSKAERYGGGSSGIVAVYDLNGNLQSTLTAPNANASTGGYQFFGTQVGWTGSRMVASAPQNTGNIYWDCYFRVYEENGTFVEQVELPNVKTKMFGEKMDVTGPECTSNKVVLSCRNGNAYVYDLDAADIAGSQVAITVGPDGTTIHGVAINDSYVYVGLGNSDTVKVYDHSGTFQFDIIPTSDVLTALGETTASMRFGANIETTNHHLAITTGTNGKVVIYDIQGNNPAPFDTLGGSYGVYWSGGMQFYQ